jgi:hypothetical protein
MYINIIGWDEPQTEDTSQFRRTVATSTKTINVYWHTCGVTSYIQRCERNSANLESVCRENEVFIKCHGL